MAKIIPGTLECDFRNISQTESPCSDYASFGNVRKTRVP